MKSALPVAVLCLAALTGCVTSRIDPPPSPAVLEARAKATAAKTAKADPCALYTFATAAPVTINFPYGSTEPAEDGQVQIERIGVWLGCHPEVWVHVTGAADSTTLPAAQQAQADARATAVRTRLAAAGLQPQRILAHKPATGATLVLEARGRGW